MIQKYSNRILGAVVVFIVVGLMLALIAGCGEKEDKENSGAEETNEEREETINEETGEVTAETEEEFDEPELPNTEVQEIQDGDITEEVTSDGESAETESEETTTNATEETTADANETASEEELAQEDYKVISIKGYKAYPEELTIKVGTTVEWRNVNDKLLHIIGWNGQKQDGVKPESLKIGESWSYKFEKPGKIVWFSTARPTVQGTIYIEE